MEKVLELRERFPFVDYSLGFGDRNLGIFFCFFILSNCEAVVFFKDDCSCTCLYSVDF